MNAVRKILGSWLVIFTLAGCGKNTDGEKSPVVPPQLYVPLVSDATEATRVPFSIQISNPSQEMIQLVQVGASCSCLSFDLPLPVSIPAKGRHEVAFFVQHDPSLIRRGGSVLFRFGNGAMAKTDVTLISGVSIDVAPMAANMFTTAGTPARFVQNIRLYAQNAGELPVTGRLKGRNEVDYSFGLAVLRKTDGLVVYEMTHLFNSGFPEGRGEYEVEVMVGGNVMERASLNVVACSPGYIPPAIVSRLPSGAELSATLMVPWLEPKDLKSIDLGRAVAKNSVRFEGGALSFLFPAEEAAPGTYQVLPGKLSLADGRSCSFELVAP